MRSVVSLIMDVCIRSFGANGRMVWLQAWGGAVIGSRTPGLLRLTATVLPVSGTGAPEDSSILRKRHAGFRGLGPQGRVRLPKA